MEEQSSNKRKPKGPIKFQISLNEEQKRAKEIILNNTVTVLTGRAGSGKTTLAAQVALDMLFRGDIDKITLARPAVTSGEEVGILPGGIDEKLAPYVDSIYENIYSLYNKEKIDNCIKEGSLKIIPLGFMRGRNLKGCVIVDEAQNMTHKQSKLLLTRICKDAKLILCGDVDQIDLRYDVMSGFSFMCNILAKEVPHFTLVTLEVNHRDPIVDEILKQYAKHGI